MPAPLLSKDEVLERLTQVFRDYGYDGATLSLMSQATGLVKASLYHYFPKGKQDMASAVLERLGAQFQETVLAPLQKEDEPAALIRNMCNNVAAFYRDGTVSCILEIFSLGHARELFQDTIRQRLHRWVEILAGVLARSGLDEALAHKRAAQAIMKIEGALVMRRAMDDQRVFLDMLADLPADLLSP